MKKLFFLLMFIAFSISTKRLLAESLMLTPEEIEAIFLKQNLMLVAQQMNVSIADAEIAQAKLWDNPTLSISDVNLWSSNSQREGESEVIPPIFGSFTKNTQFSIELSQLIQTANKRGKLVSREKVSKEIAIQEFEIVLRGLKTELRKTISEIIYLQNYLKVLDTQEETLNQIVSAYTKQVAQGNISKSELLRLQSSLLEIENESQETHTDLNEQLKVLKSLLSAEPLSEIQIIDTEKKILDPEKIALASLLEKSANNRVDIKLSKLQTQYFDKSLAYEKSQRIPDITFSANYDRRGGVWRDFIGFGVSIDLPFLNRNQGGIKSAKLSYEQSQYNEKQQINQAQHEVVEAYNNYRQAYRFYQKTSKNNLLSELDNMLNTYAKNLLNRNINMLEYIDFMEAYKDNKNTVLTGRKKVQLQFEELQYIVGTEINNTL